MQSVKNKTIPVTSQNCVGPIMRMGREVQCLPYAGFLFNFYNVLLTIE